jgi:AraC-like DNA-binding protein
MPARALRGSTIVTACVFKLRELAEDAGVDPRALAGVELPPPGRRGFEARVPFERQIELWEAAMRTLRDPGFPIAVASRLRPSDYSVIGFACMTRASLRDALEQAVRYTRIWCDASHWEFCEHGGTASLTRVGEAPRRLGMRCNTECALAEMLNAARAVSGRDFIPHEVRFRHASPPDTRSHAAFFRAPLRFDAPADDIRFDPSLLDAPLVQADTALAAYFQRHVDALLRRLAPPESLAGRLEALLASETRHGSPTLEAAAKRLGTSSRTLRRRLQDEGTSFHQVLDRARCELAKRYLADLRMPVGEIGFLLGFSEPSAFHRAFKRWTGTTPFEHRERSPGPVEETAKAPERQRRSG